MMTSLDPSWPFLPLFTQVPGRGVLRSSLNRFDKWFILGVRTSLWEGYARVAT